MICLNPWPTRLSRLRKIKNNIQKGLFVPGIFIVLVLAHPGHAYTQTNFLWGSAFHPFPLIMSFDYAPTCCLAWLNALSNSENLLPSNIYYSIHSLNLDPVMGKLAICALLFPVEVVTPEISSSAEIRVYLKQNESQKSKIKEILENPLELIEEILLISEIKSLLSQIRKVWPIDLNPDHIDYPLIDKLTGNLRALWNWICFPGYDSLKNAYINCRTSIAIQLKWINQKIEERRPEEVFKLIDSLEEQLASDNNVTNHDLLRVIQVYILFLKGKTHLQLGQMALAERNFLEAIEDISIFVSCPDLGRELMRQLAFIMRERGNISAMCRYLDKACEYGDCGLLLEARIQNICSREQRQ